MISLLERCAFEGAWEEEDRRFGPPGRLIRFLRWFTLWAPFGAKIFPKHDGSGYLGRVYLVPWLNDWWFGPNLHYFFASDSDEEHHNHPWKEAWSVILVGGYREERLRSNNGSYSVSQIWRSPGDFFKIGRNDFHRVRLEGRNPWTLFLTGRRVRAPQGEDWGFKDPHCGCYVAWKPFCDQKRAELERATRAA